MKGIQKLHNFRRGFTLIELSIVLVIIGLVIGGVVLGKDLIRAAELKSIVTDIEKFKVAARTFRSKYGGLPGDIPNAEEIWGSDAGCPATPANDIPKIVTCNSNGDGFIGDPDETMVSGLTTWWEPSRAWQQLSNAGLIGGTFSGAISTAAGGYRIGINIPASKIVGTGYTLSYNGPQFATFIMYEGSAANKHFIAYGTAPIVAATLPLLIGPALFTSELLSIDQKVDDGRPAFGSVQSFTSTHQPCSTTDVPTTAIYNIAETRKICTALFVTGF